MVILSNVENIDFGLNQKDNQRKCLETDNDQENTQRNRRVNSGKGVDEVSCPSSEPESETDDPDYSEKESGSENEFKKRKKGKRKKKGADLDDWDNTDDESDNEVQKNESEMSEYERRRRNNIAEFQNMYKQMFGKAPGTSPEREELGLSSWKAVSSERRQRQRRNSSDPEFRASVGRRLSLPLPTRRSARVTNSYYRSTGEGTWISNLPPIEKLETLIQLRYGGVWPRNEKHSDSSGEEEDEDENFLGFREGFRGFEDEDKPNRKKLQKHKRSMPREWKPRIRAPRTIIPPEEISDSKIANITYRSANKIYDNYKGTTCHQCRQKTLDTKTICRSSTCSGVRGQFCGFCLKTRYGEDAAEALKNPTWECPPCRNICNCSICRTRKGKMPTGILKPVVEEKGFDSVYHFLKTLKDEKLSEDEF